ncbi:MAG: DegV family protein [Caldisericaceae bacterium]
MIKIVVDSTGYLDSAFVEQNNISVVPLKVRLGDNEYVEGKNFSPDDFYRILREVNKLPKTSQPSVQDFLDVYSKAINGGYSVISIHLSEKISGTINAARMAINTLKTDKIKIVDSMSTTFTIRFLAEYAAKLISQGNTDFDDVYTKTQSLVKRLYNRFIFDDIKYVVEGGRLNKAEGIIGSLLNIKPILSFTDGVVKPEGVSRTWKKAKENLVQFTEKIKQAVGMERLCVVYGENVNEGKEFADMVKDHFKIDVDTLQCGAVIGTYAGPIWLAVGIQSER